MTSRNVIKAAAGMEDLLVGVGTATQTRGGVSMSITKADVAFAVSTVVAMQALDVAKYHRARVYISASNVAEYLYDAADNTGISSDTGPGTWVAAPVAAKVLAVSDKTAMQTTEPAVARQLAVALGATALGVGYGGVYWYDETDSTSPDDGDLVLVTTGGARWKRVLIEADQLEQVKDAAGSANGLTANFGMLVVPETKIIWLRAVHTNSGAVTLNVDGSGVFAVQYADGSALTAGAIEDGKVYGFIRTGSVYKIMNPSVSAAAVTTGTDNHGMLTALRLSAYLSPYWTNLGQAMVDIGVLQGDVSGMLTDITDAQDSADNVEAAVQTFLVNGTYTKPGGYAANDTVLIRVWGGGAGGHGNQVGGGGGGVGGGGGGFNEVAYRYSDITSTLAVVIGQGGAGGAWSGVGLPGVSGGDTTVTGTGVFVGASGGLNTGVGGQPLFFSASSQKFSVVIYNGGDSGADGIWGAGGGQHTTGSTTGRSVYGGAGGAVLAAGVVPGGGGGASTNAYQSAGAAGADGQVEIRVVKGWHPTMLSQAWF